MEHVQSRDGAQDQERSTVSSDPFEFLACVMESAWERDYGYQGPFIPSPGFIHVSDSNFRPYLFFRHAWHTLDV